MTVIAMTRELGTRGKDVAEGIAERMNLRLINHELIEGDVAQRMNADEEQIHRFIEGKQTLLERWRLDAKKLSRFTAEEVLTLAKEGNVLIRGWGATSLLRPIPHVACIRVCAPMEFRERIVVDRLGLPDRLAARREITTTDAGHARVAESFLGANWESPTNFDLVLNSARMSVEQCVDQIQMLVLSEAFTEDDDTRNVIVDRLIEMHVTDALAQELPSGSSPKDFNVSVYDRRVVLSGATSDRMSMEQAMRIARGVQDVVAVESNVSVVNPRHFTM